MTIPSGAKQILLHGMALILVGLLWGFAPPPLSPLVPFVPSVLSSIPAALGLILSFLLLIAGFLNHRDAPAK
jgi:uncharacterized RDD family membrane protein YckC